jgi:hypothetical protein
VDVRLVDAGPNTYIKQLWKTLRLAGHDEPKPRKQLIHDLKAELQEGHRKGLQFLLLGDFNEVIGQSPELMASICSELSLIDTIGYFHPGDATSTPTYNRGSRRLDYGLITQALLPSISASGMNTFGEISTSDHRALFLDFNSAELFKLQTPMASPSLRTIHSESTSAADFVTHAYDHLQQHRAFEQHNAFQRTVGELRHPHLQANRIDAIITQALLSAEKKVAKPKRLPWSERLHQASATYRLWKVALTSARTHIEASDAIQAAAQKANYSGEIPTGILQLRKELKAARTTLRNIRDRAADERTAFLQLHNISYIRNIRSSTSNTLH